jgi:hypothetical protein
MVVPAMQRMDMSARTTTQGFFWAITSRETPIAVQVVNKAQPGSSMALIVRHTDGDGNGSEGVSERNVI